MHCRDLEIRILYIFFGNLDVWELQMPDGAFIGDTWGEVDTRFSYCALNCLALLNDLGEDKKEKIDKAVEFVLSCKNFDEGFGSIPGAESHAGQSKITIFEIFIIYNLCSYIFLQFSVLLVL